MWWGRELAMDYSPHNSFSARLDERRCRASVHNDFGVGFHQCCRKPVEGGLYCRTHDPAAIEARRKASNERYATKAAKEKRRNMAWHGAPFIAALREIAKGHNDPRSLAAQVLAETGFEGD